MGKQRRAEQQQEPSSTVWTPMAVAGVRGRGASAMIFDARPDISTKF